MGSYPLQFPISTPGSPSLDALGKAVQDVQGKVKLSAGEFKIFQDVLTGAAQKGGKMSSTLNQLAKDFSNSTPALKQFSAALRDDVGRSLDEAAARSTKAAAAIDISTRRIEASFGRIGGRVAGQAAVGGAGGFIGGQLASIFGIGIGGGAAIAGIALLGDLIEKQTKAADQFVNLSQRLGVAVNGTIALSRAAEDAGETTGVLTSAAEKLRSALDNSTKSGGRTIETLKSMGVAFTNLDGTAKPILEDVIHALGGIADQSERARKAHELFGASADKILPLAKAYHDAEQAADGFSNVLNDKVATRIEQIAARSREIEAIWRNLWDNILTFNGRGADDAARTYRGIPLAGDPNLPRNADGSPFRGPASESRLSHRALSTRYKSNAAALGRLVGAATQEDLTDNEVSAKIEFESARSAADLASKGQGVDDQHYAELKRNLEQKRQAYQKAKSAADAFRNASRSDTSITKRRAELSAALSSEGATPDELGRFLKTYGVLQSSPIAAQRLQFAQGLIAVAGKESGAYFSKAGTIESRSENQQARADDREFEGGLRRDQAGLKAGYEETEKQLKLSDELTKISSAGGRSRDLLRLRQSGKLAGISEQNPFSSARSVAAAESAENKFSLSEALENAEKLTDQAEKEKAARKASQDYATESLRIQLDYQLKIAEIGERSKRDFGNAFSDLVISAQNGGARGVQGFLRNKGEGIESKVLSNFAQNYIYPQIQNAIPHSNGGFFGKLLEGTPFGDKTADPAIRATDLNTKSTDLNTAANLAVVQALTGQAVSLPGGGGGGIPSFNIPGLGTFGSDTNGITGNGPLATLSSIGYPSSGLPASGAESAGGGGGLSLGKIATIGGAALGAFKGIDDLIKGGAKRTAGGVGELLGSAASIAAIIPGGQLVAAGLGIAAGVSSLVSAVLPDPRVQRQNQISKNLFTSQYLAPQAINASFGSNGGYSDVDEFGNVRSSNLSPYPIVSNPYLDVPRRTVVPGHTISPFGGYSNQTGADVTQGQAPITIHVQAMDHQSFIDHASNIADALNHAIQSNLHPVVQSLRRQI